MPVPSNPQDLINIIREKLFNNTSGLIEEPDLREVLENIVKVLDAKFSMFSPNLTEEQFAKWNLILDYMVNETKGVLSPTSPAPTGKGKYLLSSAGTYTNLGGLIADPKKINYAYFNGTIFTLVAVDLSLEPSNYFTKSDINTKIDIYLNKYIPKWNAQLKKYEYSSISDDGTTVAVENDIKILQQLFLLNIPTSPNSLPSGSVWRDGNTLKIV